MSMRSPVTTITLAISVLFGILVAPSTAFAVGVTVPFTDPNQVGSLTLCNPNEQPITSGSLLTIPFVWRAVSSAPAPKGYTRAQLSLFQPIQYIDPGDWTGYQLTDAAVFTNPAHPMAQATYADNPLLFPDHSMAPHWDGLYQLRMTYSSPNTPAETATYPGAVIHVSGNNWTLVQGGGSSCTAGSAESVESMILPQSETAVPKPPEQQIPYADRTSTTTVGKGKSKGRTASPTTAAAGSGSHGNAVANGGASAAADPGHASSSSSSGLSAGAIAGVVIGVLVLAGAAGLWAFRRRSRSA
jgi:hypothetical protein